LAFEYPDAGSDKPHFISYATARTVADDGLLEIWNGVEGTTLALRVNKDGQLQLEDGTVGAPAVAAADDKDTGIYFVSGTPEVATAVAGAKVLSVVAAGIVVTGTVVATGGGSLTGTWSDLGSVTTVDINGGTVGGVTLDGTISGTPTWASAQAITLSTAAQTNITSLGTLTALTVTTSVTAATFVGDLTGNVTGNVSGTAATVTGAAQTNITSLGTLTALTVNGALVVSTVNGIDINPGSDVDVDVITLGVTTAPKLWWDESDSSWEFTGNLTLNDGQLRANGDAKIAGASSTLGFYGDTGVLLQTGVAVTAGGIHAALVALNLITA
jgi:hypothetical protein